MNGKNKRLLTHHFPALAESNSLPVNYAFAQLYSLSVLREDGIGDISALDSLNIKVLDYQTDSYEIMATLGKPISKIIQ